MPNSARASRPADDVAQPAAVTLAPEEPSAFVSLVRPQAGSAAAVPVRQPRPATTAPARHPAPAPQRSEWADPRTLMNVLILSCVSVTVLSVWMLADLGGWRYYRIPLRIRGYAPWHEVLRPSGRIGHPLGIVGLLMMCVPFLYAARKKSKRMARFGSVMAWLDVHIFCGIVGPAMVVFHTSFKFNGAVSVAFWAMLLVVGSGFVGRYFYVRIPKTIRGTEMTYDQILGQAAELKGQVTATRLSGALLEKVEAFERAVAVRPEHVSIWKLPFGRMVVLRRLSVLRHELRQAGVQDRLLREVVRLTDTRMLLLRRLAYLHRTRTLFAMWHLFHKPLVWLMLVIAVLHLVMALYFGYLPF